MLSCVCAFYLPLSIRSCAHCHSHLPINRQLFVCTLFEDTDKRQAPVVPGKVHSIADDKLVWAVETAIVDLASGPGLDTSKNEQRLVVWRVRVTGFTMRSVWIKTLAPVTRRASLDKSVAILTLAHCFCEKYSAINLSVRPVSMRSSHIKMCLPFGSDPKSCQQIRTKMSGSIVGSLT